MSDGILRSRNNQGRFHSIDVDDVIKQLEEKYALDPQLLDDLISGIGCR